MLWHSLNNQTRDKIFEKLLVNDDDSLHYWQSDREWRALGLLRHRTIVITKRPDVPCCTTGLVVGRWASREFKGCSAHRCCFPKVLQPSVISYCCSRWLPVVKKMERRMLVGLIEAAADAAAGERDLRSYQSYPAFVVDALQLFAVFDCPRLWSFYFVSAYPCWNLCLSVYAVAVYFCVRVV